MQLFLKLIIIRNLRMIALDNESDHRSRSQWVPVFTEGKFYVTNMYWFHKHTLSAAQIFHYEGEAGKEDSAWTNRYTGSNAILKIFQPFSTHSSSPLALFSNIFPWGKSTHQYSTNSTTQHWETGLVWFLKSMLFEGRLQSLWNHSALYL